VVLDYAISRAHCAVSVYCWKVTAFVAVKPEHVAERGVERCTAGFHGAAIATEHHDVVAALNERAGRHGEVINRRHQPREYTLANGLRPNIGIAIRKRIALGFVPADG
jgi:hypothetical protein